LRGASDARRRGRAGCAGRQRRARYVAIATTDLYFDLRVVKQRVAETQEADEVLPAEAPPAVAPH